MLGKRWIDCSTFGRHVTLMDEIECKTKTSPGNYWPLHYNKILHWWLNTYQSFLFFFFLCFVFLFFSFECSLWTCKYSLICTVIYASFYMFITRKALMQILHYITFYFSLLSINMHENTDRFKLDSNDFFSPIPLLCQSINSLDIFLNETKVLLFHLV